VEAHNIALFGATNKVTPVEKRSSNKFCDFHNDKGHKTDECVQLKKQIEELNDKAESDSNFARVREITFPPLATSRGTEGPLVIEAEIGGHIIHRMNSHYPGGEAFNIMMKETIREGPTLLAWATVTTASKEILKEAEVRHENFKVALHSNFPDQEVAIGGTLRKRTNRTVLAP
ncbi:hypothetical protein Tco_1139524, partial [Tanacetum coccineum]